MSDPRILGSDGVPVSRTELRPSADFQLSTNFDLNTGRGTVKIRLPGTDKAYLLLPAEARILGMQLICECERAMADAIFLRVALEIFNISPTEAVQLLKTVSAGTRADHAMVYEQMLKAADREKAMAQEVKGETDGTSPTS